MTNETGETTARDDVHALMERYGRREAVVGVIGLGYVGLPLSLAAVEAGFRVVGFDIDPGKIRMIEAGQSYIDNLDASAIAAAVDQGTLTATTDLGRLGEPDAVIICVPTPLSQHRDPDLSYVENTARAVAATLRPGQLVVLESTTWPGTTVEVVRPILEAGGLKSGRDFYLAFSPEREDPGNLDFSTSRIPKVVGGDGPDALALAELLYARIVAKTVAVSSTQTAEAVKLTENIFRAVNIALVNELKVIYDLMGIDVWEVIDAAKTKPFGFMPFYPGPGLGGHCIPIDPFYLTWKAREFEVSTRFIELAGEINTRMPNYVVDRLVRALDERFQRGLNGSRILLVGIAYKKNVSDVRESPAFKVMELLEARGAVVEYFDPHAPVIPPTREHAALTGRKSIAWDPEALARYDAALILTDHDEIDYETLVAQARLVVDTRNACGRRGLTADRVVKA